MIGRMLEEAMKTDYNERVRRAKENSRTVLEYLRKCGKNDGAAALYLSVISSFAGIDGSLDDREYRFIKDVFGFETGKDELSMIVRFYSREKVRLSVVQLIRGAPQTVRSAFSMLGIDICATNGEMSEDEKELIEALTEDAGE